MNKMWKRAISSILTVLLMFELIPVQAYAAVSYEETEETAVYDSQEGDLSVEENDDIDLTKTVLTEEISDRRDEYQKEFMMENGMRLAAVYPMAVHFERDGEWEEIDNTLVPGISEEGEIYRNKEGMWDVCLPQEIDENRNITLTHDGYTLSFRIAGELKPEKTEEQEDTPEDADTEYTEEENEEETDAQGDETAEDPSGTEETAAGFDEAAIPEDQISDAETDETAEVSEEDTVTEETGGETAPSEAAETEDEADVTNEETSGDTAVNDTEEEPASAEEETYETAAEAAEASPTDTEEETEETEEASNTDETVPQEELSDITEEDPDSTETIPEETDEDQITEENPVDTEDISSEDRSSIMKSSGYLVENSFGGSAYPGSLMEDILTRISSGIRYDGIFEGTDLRYDLISNQLKETVILNEYQEGLTGYRYILNTGDLILKKEEDGTITASPQEGEEPVFFLPAPVIYDSERKMSRDIEISLEETDEGYLLTYSLSEEWLTDPERAYPVYLDPIIQPVQSTWTIQDQSVSEFHSLDHLWGCVEAGYFPPSTGGGGRERIFMKFDNLPSLTSADVVVSASVSMYKCEDGGLTIEAHQVNDTWESSTITWSNMPSTNSKTDDYRITDNEGWYTWDITNIAQNWYSKNLNTGVMFKVPDSVETGGTLQFDQFYSSDFGPAAVPILAIAYVNNCGAESTWDYIETSEGRAGTGYVNAYTGNLVWINPTLGFSGQRMPVEIQHIYNANDKSSNRFAMGYGWRTNFNQLVYQWSEDSDYYIWEDEDGTRQYFKYKSSGTYESELDSKLTLTTAGSGNTTYCIKDRKNNKRYFDSYGRLYRISNYQETVSNITIAYSGTTKRITDITDGAGRVYHYVYQDSKLVRINFKGTGSDTLDHINYTQTDDELTGITFGDGKSVSYSYDTNHLLKTATDVDGATVTYTYNHKAITKPNRVTKIRQNGYDGSFAGHIELTYTRKQTVLEDNLHHIRILQFNNWGSTTCVQNDLGQASASRYVNQNSGTTDNRKTGSQVALQSKLQNTVNDLLLNGGFEHGNSYWAVSSSGSMALVDTPYRGEKAIRLKQTGTGTPERSFIRNTSGTWVTDAEEGEVYTVSAYVKVTDITEGGDGAYISLGSSENNSLMAVSESVTAASNGWKRVEATVAYPSGLSGSLLVFLNMDSFGTAIFDCVQLEKAATASRYDLIENGDFSYPRDSSESPSYWSRGSSSNTTTEKRVSVTDHAPCLDSKAVKMTGSPSHAKTYYQDIPVSGSSGDVYTLTGWARADSVPISDDRTFSLIIRFHNTDGTNTDRALKFNPCVGNSGNWQYGALRAASTKAYSSITVTISYNYNGNTAYFDGIQLFKEEFGQSFTYDSDGNIISVKDLHGKTTEYEYASNDLTKIILPSGAEQEYTYDSWHNVKTATSPEGVKTSFTYDTYGNNTAVTVGTGDKRIRVNATYTSDGNQLSTLKNTDRQITTYSYNEQTGALKWVERPGEDETTRTGYTYDGMHRLKKATKDSLSTTYTYSDRDLLTGISSPSGTSYGYTYNSFNQLRIISIGGNNLITNSYESGTHYLSGTGFANGDGVTYTYDDFGRVKSAVYEDNEEALYDYNSEGDLGLVRYGNETVRYYYDFQGELRGIDTKRGTDKSTVRWTYDTDNNLTKTVEKVGGKTYTTNYTYDDDNRVESLTLGNINVTNTYDQYNGITKILAKYSTDTAVKTDITYRDISDLTASYKFSRWKNTAGGNVRTYDYTYDSRGNIKTISYSFNNETSNSSYVYDDKDQLIRENDQKSGKTLVYAYNGGGNITSKKEYAYTTGTLGSVLSTKNYSYGSTAWDDKLTSYAGNTLSYDSMGNLTSDGEWTYTWEHGSQLSGMSDSDNSISYTYNADGLRTQKTVNGTTTKYFYAGNQLTFINRSGNKLHFVYDSIGPVTVTYNSTVYYYLRNAQGDITGITDNTGAGVVYYFYDAWGNPTSVSGSMANTLGKYNPFRYRGYVYDEETGLYYLNSRYYDPELCRFISADSLAVPTISPGSASWDKNLYAYCDNNPVTRKDAGGECWDIVIGAAVGGIIGGVSSAINSYISTGELDVGTVAQGFVVGAITGGIGGSALGRGVIAITNAIISGISSYSSGASIGEAIITASTSALTSIASKGASNLFSNQSTSLADSISKGIVTLNISAQIEGLAIGGKSIYKELTAEKYYTNNRIISNKLNSSINISRNIRLSLRNKNYMKLAYM